MNTYIYGAGNIGKQVAKKLKEYGEILEGFIDSFKTGSYEGYPILSISEIDKATKVIISVLNTNSILEIYSALRKQGIKNIYWFYDTVQNCDDSIEKSFWVRECLDLSEWGNMIMPHVELHISDKCNLNCKGCTHFSPLFDEVGAIFEKKLDDISELKRLFPDIFRIDILGGEPLLNPELSKYVIELRKELPSTFIQIYTNGLLLPGLADDVLETIYKYNVGISISEYYPTHLIMDKIIDRLNLFHIRYRIARYDSKQLFNKPISTNPDSKYPRKCISNGCITISDGLISRCPTLMYIDKFNDYFEQNLPTEGIYRIADYKNGNDLLEDMGKKVSLCKHCIEYDMKWSVCGKEKKLEDFAVND